MLSKKFWTKSILGYFYQKTKIIFLPKNFKVTMIITKNYSWSQIFRFIWLYIEYLFLHVSPCSDSWSQIWSILCWLRTPYLDNFSIFFCISDNPLASPCPTSHPNAYMNGQSCCRTNLEKVRSLHGDQCDGSELVISSKCCENNDSVKCPYHSCHSRATWTRKI